MKKRTIIIILVSVLVPILLIGSIIGGVKVYSSRNNNDNEFLRNTQAKIQNIIIQQLDPKKDHIKSLTIVDSSAKGYYDNGGDVGGMYHVDFVAYVNGDKNYDLKGTVDFPNAAIGPFTFIKSNPYKDKNQNMNFDNRDVSVEVSNNSKWDWKRAADEAIAESESQETEASAKVETARCIPLIQQWLTAHQTNLSEAIDAQIKSENASKAKELGPITSIKLRNGSEDNWHDLSGSTKALQLTVTFGNFQSDTAWFTIEAEFDDKTLNNVSKGATFNFDTQLHFNADIHNSKLWDAFYFSPSSSTGTFLVNGTEKVNIE